jgi:hypothetical protein
VEGRGGGGMETEVGGGRVSRALGEGEEVEIPTILFCPITGNLMVDPVPFFSFFFQQSSSALLLEI